MIFLLHLTLRSRRKCRSGGFSSHSGLLRLRFPSSHTSFNSPITLIRAGYLFQVIQKWTPSQPHLSLLVCSMGKTNKHTNKQTNKQTKTKTKNKTKIKQIKNKTITKIKNKTKSKQIKTKQKQKEKQKQNKKKKKNKTKQKETNNQTNKQTKRYQERPRWSTLRSLCDARWRKQVSSRDFTLWLNIPCVCCHGVPSTID